MKRSQPAMPPVRLIEPDPAAAVTVPLQVVASPFGVATCKPAGSVSLNATPVSASDVFGLLSVEGQRGVCTHQNAGRAKRLGDSWRRSYGQIG